ncbi:RluA family pseudouridine synthase [Desulfobulbus alkaliphilus]|uniref:RluA family pseudouridine synthase n=1 Tax=Desulfobulbus alkaliphilus TaxID=869814 RepID=UPI00196519FB|nr:RluA family pseudouridine synthase [Desulfobulbus alkaliphilus]MBM9536375.1 RluA family pseudouridine synthase [Desulfobulbus alkaliphilus]
MAQTGADDQAVTHAKFWKKEQQDCHTIESNEAGQRLDHVLTSRYPELSRSFLASLIHSGHILVEGRQVKAAYKVRAQDSLTIVFPPSSPSPLQPERIDFPILFEDEHLLVLTKPPGLVVHPGSGQHSGTLVHGLLYRYLNLPAADADRPGIVHRLDKETSGVMLVAKNNQALRTLMAAFKNREINKTYHALLSRCPHDRQGKVIGPIARHPVHRKKMAIDERRGRYAVTTWQIVEEFANGCCLADIAIETGRTHQIRVHMASVQAAVLGDSLYGGAQGQHAWLRPQRQMLHASTLRFAHPFSGEQLCFTAPLWHDMQAVLDILRNTRL